MHGSNFCDYVVAVCCPKQKKKQQRRIQVQPVPINKKAKKGSLAAKQTQLLTLCGF